VRKKRSARSLPSVRNKALGKELFADRFFTGCSLPSATLGKDFAECFSGFAECFGHSAKRGFPVVHVNKLFLHLASFIDMSLNDALVHYACKESRTQSHFL
jgi:hypothetical protein